MIYIVGSQTQAKATLCRELEARGLRAVFDVPSDPAGYLANHDQLKDGIYVLLCGGGTDPDHWLGILQANGLLRTTHGYGSNVDLIVVGDGPEYPPEVVAAFNKLDDAYGTPEAFFTFGTYLQRHDVDALVAQVTPYATGAAPTPQPPATLCLTSGKLVYPTEQPAVARVPDFHTRLFKFIGTMPPEFVYRVAKSCQAQYHIDAVYSNGALFRRKSTNVSVMVIQDAVSVAVQSSRSMDDSSDFLTHVRTVVCEYPGLVICESIRCTVDPTCFINMSQVFYNVLRHRPEGNDTLCKHCGKDRDTAINILDANGFQTNNYR